MKMRIEIDINEKYEDLSVEIKSPRLTPDIEKMISMLRILGMQILGKKDNETFVLDVAEILYIEAVERDTFLYTENEVYESDFKLYELEQQLTERDFFRVSKSTLINLKKVKSLKADLNRRIRVTMVNGEQIIASRMYADELRKRLGIK
ncbi:MAG TPA: LytTR family DNA-binding domain-containing protein [Defluviitaleaceae bacterium]|nr:LytTR family DNA-binding domain-containing protein [Defluviitaleaceae bacterium]HPT77114.1 LytTR family DNA-binding domain-containing protein [Defluviitaleaceae bacterium]